MKPKRKKADWADEVASALSGKWVIDPSSAFYHPDHPYFTIDAGELAKDLREGAKAHSERNNG